MNIQTFNRKNTVRGFTLIEVMITIAIVAILATIAVPSYTDYVIRGRIPQATNNLASMRVRMEQHFQDNRTYVGACAAGSVAALPPNDNFTYSCPVLTATAFTVQAVGTGAVAGFTYTINQNNVRATPAVKSGWGAASATCWIVRKGDSC